MGLSAQKNYADFLVQGAFTYWSLTKSVCHPQWNMIEKGLCIGKDSLFDWYRITDENDTLSLGDGMDWNFYADHRSFELNKDTLFVIQWDINDSGFQEPCDLIPDTVQAYKILYITKQKLLLLSLVKDSLSQWVEYRNLKCNELIILEFDCSGVMDGELWMSRKRIPCNERFEFSGKERDEETGYDYFGARNYTSAASIWLSPDPLSDKYPEISPYAYCAWSPMKYVDPDGRDVYRYDEESGNFSLYQKTNDSYDQIGKFKYNRKNGNFLPKITKIYPNIQLYILHNYGKPIKY